MTLDQLQHFQNSPRVILLLVLEEYLKERGVENQSPEAIDLLMKIIKKGHTDVDYRDAVGNTFLMCASIKKHLNVVKFLLKQGANVELKNDLQWTPLMFAAKSGDCDVIKALVGQGAQVDAQDAKGWTALGFSIFAGHLQAVATLIELGANLEQANDLGVTPLELAVHANHKEIASFLIYKGAQVERILQTSLDRWGQFLKIPRSSLYKMLNNAKRIVSLRDPVSYSAQFAATHHNRVVQREAMHYGVGFSNLPLTRDLIRIISQYISMDPEFMNTVKKFLGLSCKTFMRSKPDQEDNKGIKKVRYK